MRMISMALAAVMLAGGALAEPMAGDVARKQMFKTGKVDMLPSVESGLTADQAQLLAKDPRMKYYGALAFDPSQGALGVSPVYLAAHYHSIEDARAAALAECKAQSGKACKIGLEVLPRNYEARAITLNNDATDALGKDYRRAKAPKAMAISKGTGEWAFDRGDMAVERALAACNAKSQGKNDCEIVVQD